MADLLTLRGIRKTFPGVKALDGVDFTLRAGEIHALMGENGAGKSTLIKVMTGVYSLDSGSIALDGAEIHIKDPQDAVRQGISTVYQEVNLAPNLSVAENVCLGRESHGFGGIKWGEVRSRASAALSRLGLSIDVRRPLGSYSIAIQQMTAIARALDVSAKVLVLDEPTSSLDRDEVRQLFDAMRKLRSEGMGIVFVTHFLDQVYEVSDRITVLRNGSLVGSSDASSLPRLELVSQMIGRDASVLESQEVSKAEASGPSVVETAGLGRTGSVEGLNFDVKEGEVLGLAGLLGSGRTETVRLLFGIDAPSSGSLFVGGANRRRYGTARAIDAGLGLCPEDRKLEGILPDLSVRENMTLVLQAKQGWFRRLRRKEQDLVVDQFIKSLRIATADAETPIKNLSGGNQQKVLLARWLAANPRLLLLDEPTRGIDVGAKFEIASLIEKLRGEGMGFVFVSSELEEVVRSCTKIAVLRDRKMVGLLRGSDATEEKVMSMIAGSDA